MTLDEQCETNPLVTVLMCAFNMERYIPIAIQSVLEQTYKNFELVVIDDGSTDQTLMEARKFEDPRVRVFTQMNQGPSCALNYGLSKIKGDYIAFFSADDVCNPTRIEASLKVCNKKNLVFSKVDLIDDDGLPIFESNYASELFEELNLSPPEALARLVTRGNYLNACTAFVSKEVLGQFYDSKFEGPFNPCLIQLQDYELWLRFAKKGVEIKIEDQAFTKYRIRSNPKAHNLGKPTREAVCRDLYERSYILRHLADGLDHDVYRSGFRESLYNQSYEGKDRQKAEIAMMLLSNNNLTFRFAAIELLYDLFSSREGRKILQDEYNFGFATLMKAMSENTLFMPMAETSLQKCTLYYRNADEFFSEDKSFRKRIDLDNAEVRIKFNFKPELKVAAVRFDLYEGAFDKMFSFDVVRVLVGQETFNYPLDKILSNGQKLNDRDYSFENNADPQFEFHFDQPPSSVIFQGTLSSC